MNSARTLLTLELAFEEALTWLTCQLSAARLRVVRTFDLLETFHDPAECPCPHPPGEVCTCRMVILLVYGEGYLPASLVAQGNSWRTCFALVDNAHQPADPPLERAICQALRVDITPVGDEDSSRA